MTVRRASFFALLTVVFTAWLVAIGCGLETGGYGETEDVCTEQVHCDDGNVCTADVCGEGGICVHTAVANGQFPDGVTGNCKVLKCTDGVQSESAFDEDVDDGDECTVDACNASGPSHVVQAGTTCHSQGGLGKCQSDGSCSIECGHLDADGNEVECPVATGDCEVAFCDEAAGVCVLEKLDGVVVPGTAAGDCGGSYCVEGEKSDLFAAIGTACKGDTEAKLCDGAGACVECNTADDCNPSMIPTSHCFSASCTNHACVVATQPDGTQLPSDQQIQKDCKIKQCAGSVVVDVPENLDLPDDGNACTADSCVGGVKTFVPTGKDSPCGSTMELFCDGAGTCVGCTTAGQCGTATDCHQYACAAGTCSDVYPDVDTPVPAAKQTPGDCLLTVCDGGGGEKPKNDDGDLPNDNNDCTLNQCSAGSKVFPPVSAGSVCLANRVCNAVGNCLGGTCVGAADCPGNGPCVDGVCCNSACGTTCAACTVALKGNGLNGDCGTSMAGSDNNDTDCPGAKVCDGTQGGAACKLPVGQGCSLAGECLSGNCVDGYCCNSACNSTCQVCNLAANPGTCTNIPNGQDPANECPGVVNCNGGAACGNLLGNGVACALNSECQSTFCVDGVCCNGLCGGNCQACNLAPTMGTCTSIAAEQDPANECGGALVCNGAGACKTPLSGGCAQPSDCASGFCADGVCCNSACSGLCRACNLAGSTGTCSNIANGQDPANECVLTTSCNGAGACATFGLGTACTMGTECTSGFCADGVCCTSTCTGVCKSCGLAGSVGTCSNIANGQDPVNECTGAQVCNGAGVCAGGPNGTACVAGSECASGSCADGVCCNSACGGVCKSCGLAGSVGTCSNIANGQDPANECVLTTSCNGAGACATLVNGTACTMGTECTSGVCTDGVCCGTACTGVCQACSAAKTGGTNGTCGNVTNNTDPEAECLGATTCNGSGACTKLADGAACTMSGAAGECMSTFCVDGVCCGTACNSACQACSAMKTGGTNGTCGNIPANTDPDNDCPGAIECNGAGACEAPLGGICTMDSQCQSNFCADGFCCNAACNGTCEACSMVLTGQPNGTCTTFAVNTDPANECPGAQICSMLGTCVKASDGAVCPMDGADSDCASNHCTDGVCCTTANCNGTCKSCNQAKTVGAVAGVCDFIKPNSDPDMECMPAQKCDGSGSCIP